MLRLNTTRNFLNCAPCLFKAFPHIAARLASKHRSFAQRRKSLVDRLEDEPGSVACGLDRRVVATPRKCGREDPREGLLGF
jgi:hypothetical protein